MKMFWFLGLLAFTLGGSFAPAPCHADRTSKSFIVVFKDHPGKSELRWLEKHQARVKRRHHRLPVIVAQLSTEALEELAGDPRVAHIEEDALIQAIAPLAGEEYDKAWGVGHVGARQAHEAGVLGGGVTVAVLDTGIDYTHPELVQSYAGGIDLANDDDDPMDDSSGGHGTHVAGTIAAARNGADLVGVAPGAALFAVKVLSGGGYGSISDIIAGIDWAMDNDMDIINMSFGFGGQPSLALEDACSAAEEAGLTLIAAAGNTSGGAVSYPASYQPVIAVNGLDAFNTTTWYSASAPEVEFSAPSTAITSTAPQGTYNTLTGTSQAVSHLTGIAALALSAGVEDFNGDGRRNDDLRALLQAAATDLGTTGRDETFGFGLVQAPAVLQRLAELRQVAHGGGIVAQIEAPYDGQGGSEELNLAGGAYRIRVVNNGLQKVRIKVYSQNRMLRGPSRVLHFGEEVDGEKEFVLGTLGQALSVKIQPLGPEGATAEVTLVPLSTAEAGSGPDLQQKKKAWQLPPPLQ